MEDAATGDIEDGEHDLRMGLKGMSETDRREAGRDRVRTDRHSPIAVRHSLRRNAFPPGHRRRRERGRRVLPEFVALVALYRVDAVEAIDADGNHVSAGFHLLLLAGRAEGRDALLLDPRVGRGR